MNDKGKIKSYWFIIITHYIVQCLRAYRTQILFLYGASLTYQSNSGLFSIRVYRDHPEWEVKCRMMILAVALRIINPLGGIAGFLMQRGMPMAA